MALIHDRKTIKYCPLRIKFPPSSANRLRQAFHSQVTK